jgi:hypothetical protein
MGKKRDASEAQLNAPPYQPKKNDRFDSKSDSRPKQKNDKFQKKDKVLLV